LRLMTADLSTWPTGVIKWVKYCFSSF